MAIPLIRAAGYYVEPTPAGPTAVDPIAGSPMVCETIYYESDPEPLPPVPVHETRRDHRDRWIALGLALVGGVVLFDAVVRIVVAWR